MLQLVNGLKQSHGREMGLYIEIKGAEIHRQYNLDPAKKLLAILEKYNFRKASDPVWIQSFDAEVLKTLKHEYKTRIKLLQLIGENRWQLSYTDFEYLKTEVGLNEVSEYADGIGPWINHVVTGKNVSGDLKLTGLVKMAHLRNLKVHAYTLRKDRLPSYAETFEDLLHIFFNLAQVDGVITDFPDQAIKFLEKTEKNDFVLFLISGGGSALSVYPNSISLHDKILVNEELIRSGASINEIACIRKHLSLIKGGRLIADMPCKGISFLISDVIGDDIGSISSGISYCDKSSYNDALKIIKKFSLQNKLPKTALSILNSGASGKIPETPKKPIIKNIIIVW